MNWNKEADMFDICSKMYSQQTMENFMPRQEVATEGSTEQIVNQNIDLKIDGTLFEFFSFTMADQGDVNVSSANLSGGKGDKLFDHLKNHLGKLSFVLYVSGIISFGLMFYEGANIDKTYFSDNALLPGLVNREFTIIPSYISNLEKSLEKELNSQTVGSGKMPVSWLMSTLASTGVETYSQNFTFCYPFGSKPKFHGTNVYGILRGPRAPSTEALVISIPFRGPRHVHDSNIPGVILLMALAKYFAKGNYWAKDVVFLIADHELIGFKAWLDSYHGMNDLDGIVQSETLQAVSGAIQAAVNLELKSSKVSHLNLKIEGLNGQLPNLDLFNVAVELATRESVTPTFHGSSHPYSGREIDVWMKYAKTIGSMMVSQASSLPTGAHGLFQKYAIQSLTLEGVTSKNTKISASVSLLQIGRVVEGLFRSLNNMLEKFNRSFWFYLLPSTRRYVSIGYYMISFGLITMPVILKALRDYITLFPDFLTNKPQVNGDSGQRRNQESKVTDHPNLINSISICFISHILGVILLSLPTFLEKFDHLVPPGIETSDILYYTIISYSLICMMSPVTIGKSKNGSEASIIALLNWSLLVSCVSLINISLGLFLSFIYTPILFLVTSRRFNLKCIKLLSLLLLHPMVIHFACLLGTSIYIYKDEPNETVMKHLSRAVTGQKKSVLYFVEDWYLYGNWNFILATSFLFPVWLQLWLVTL